MDTLTRLATALVLLAVLVPAIYLGGAPAVAVLVAVFGGIALWELANGLAALKSGPGRWITPLLGVLIVGLFLVVPYRALPAVLVFFPLLVLILHLALYHVIENTIESTAEMVLALAYVAVPLSHAVALRKLDEGIGWVFFVLLTICLGDVGAYFTGRYLGRHRITPNVSPGKTLEGLGGVLLGSFAGMLVIKLVFPGLPDLVRVLVPLTVALAVVGPLGDLLASAIKRKVGIKDYGSIFPGHGGVMDRADSLILAIPVTFYYLVLFGYSVPK
ncbi:MAG: phosphatidate cytidylyltransferase [Thermodesulfobacteriota bacterium]